MRAGRTPFGSLVAVNEHTLKEGKTLPFVHVESLKVLLIPVAGELHYSTSDVDYTIDVGQASYVSLPSGTPLEFSNRYTSSSINFLQICLRAEENTDTISHLSCTFDLDDSREELVALTVASEERFLIGRLRGRQEVIVRKELPRSGIFVYEIGGTCEVQERLLLPGDALSLINVETIEFEALTQEAIVFVAEVPFP